MLVATFLVGGGDVLPGLTVFANSLDPDHIITIQREDDAMTIVVHHVDESPAACANETQSKANSAENNHRGTHVFHFTKSAKAVRGNSLVGSVNGDGHSIRSMAVVELLTDTIAAPKLVLAKFSRPPPILGAGLHAVQATVRLI